MRTPAYIIGILALFFALQTSAHAQVGARLEYIRPSGKMGKIFGGGPGLTLEYSPRNTIRRVNPAIYAGAFRITPHQDSTNSSYTIRNSGGTFVPGFESYQPYLYGVLGLQATFRLFVDQPFTPIGYIGVGGYTSRQEYRSFSGTVDESALVWDSGLQGGLGIGFEYELDRTFSGRLLLTHNGMVNEESQGVRYWSLSLGGLYYW